MGGAENDPVVCFIFNAGKVLNLATDALEIARSKLLMVEILTVTILFMKSSIMIINVVKLFGYPICQ